MKLLSGVLYLLKKYRRTDGYKESNRIFWFSFVNLPENIMCIFELILSMPVLSASLQTWASMHDPSFRNRLYWPACLQCDIVAILLCCYTVHFICCA